MTREQQLARALDDLRVWVEHQIHAAEDDRRNARTDIAWQAADAACKAFEAMAAQMDTQRAELQRRESR